MRSTVGWLCFGILVVCVISVQSDVSSSGGYEIIDGHSIGYPGQLFQRVLMPSNEPHMQARHVEARNDDYQDSAEYEHEQGNEGEEDTNSREDPYEENREENVDPYYYDQQRIEEELDREEEQDLIEEESEFENEFEQDQDQDHEQDPSYSREESEEDEEELNRHMYENGRQAYRNNNKVQINATAQTYPKKTSNKLRATSQKKPSKGGRRKNNKKTTSSKKKKPVAETSKISNKTRETDENEKLAIKVITNPHTQFIATPIADLILKLSISLAKPVGQGNETSTYITVPVRLANNDGENEKKNNSASDAFKNKVETLLQKISSVAAISRPSNVGIAVPIKEEVPDSQKNDDKEEEGDNVDRTSP